MYCTLAEARAAGASGTDAEVLDAIGTARTLIDRYTGSVWEPTVATIVGRASPDGTVLLPWPVRSVDTVTVVGTAQVLPTSAYRVLSSLTPGQVDAVILGGSRWADALVVGAEPWNGGYSNLFGSAVLTTGQVAVYGEFGPDEVPPEVRDAAAALAGWRTGGGSLLPVSGPDTDDEGNVVSITVDASAPTPRSRTTGLPAADQLLATLGPASRLFIS